MAIGVALIFGIRLPVNFDSPYRATSIIEFWRRWHMTLSRFLRDYLYIPLGGNRCGSVRRYVNLLIVMVLGGLWHGAGWTFVVWGGLHGSYLLINHVWQSTIAPTTPNLGIRFIYWVLTFLGVVFAWVFFRAENLTAALPMIHGMLGFNGFELELNHRGYFGPFADMLENLGVNFVPATKIRLVAFSWIAGLLAICLLLPNTQQWIWRRHPLIKVGKISFWPWRTAFMWGLSLGGLAAYAISKIGQPSEFLYFNF